MRMWMVNPRIMCKKHLLGEHLEVHMFAGCILKNKPIQGYVDKNLVEINNINSRHGELSREMIRRGYRHNTPLNDIFIGPGEIDRKASYSELMKRCSDCRKLREEEKHEYI